jgi:hypothetical protein
MDRMHHRHFLIVHQQWWIQFIVKSEVVIQLLDVLSENVNGRSDAFDVSTGALGVDAGTQ